MVHYSRKLKCPYCNNWTDKSFKTSDIYLGSPVRSCEHCHRYFIDPGREENAIVYYSGKYRFKGWFTLTFFVILCACMGIGFLKDNSYGGLIPLAIAILITVLYVINIIKTAPQKRYENLKRKENLIKDVADSLERLSNPDYLAILLNHNIDVPEWFFERINATVIRPPERPDNSIKKFICDNCGKKFTGWNQICPNCRATGKIRKGSSNEISIWNEIEPIRVVINNPTKEADLKETEKIESKITSENSIYGERTSIVEDISSKEVLIHNERVPSDGQSLSYIEELVKLNDLLKSGIITQEEFDAKKKQILGL